LWRQDLKMKRLRFSIFLFWIAFLPAAYPQQQGIVEGRLINRTDPSITARGVELEVFELGTGMSIIKTATTDSSGKFRIVGLPQNQRLMIRANYQGANYHSTLILDQTGRASVDIEVFESTTSMKDIHVEEMRMAFQLAGNHLRFVETITFNNKTKPPRTLAGTEGSYRISKPLGIVELPQIRVTAPGSSMPVMQPALESADGQSYYSLYPLRPGITIFEAQQTLPYTNQSYIYNKRLYQDVGSVNIGVTPQDMLLSGPGLSKIQTDSQGNFSVYMSAPIKAGSEVAWTLSGGTPVADSQPSETAGESKVESMPNEIGRNALLISPLLLIGFILVLWYAVNRIQDKSPKAGEPNTGKLKALREQIINSIADLDHRYETKSVSRQEFLKQREESKSRLHRISLLLKKQ
jgi:hypothetical protein